MTNTRKHKQNVPNIFNDLIANSESASSSSLISRNASQLYLVQLELLRDFCELLRALARYLYINNMQMAKKLCSHYISNEKHYYVSLIVFTCNSFAV